MHPQAAQSAFIKRPLPLGPFLVFSVALHVAAVAALIGSHYLNLAPPMDLNQKPIRATLVRQGKARDPNLLPRKEEPPPPPPKKVEPDAPAPAEAKPPEKPAIPVPIPGVKPPEAPVKAARQEGAADSASRRKSLFGAFSKQGKAADAEELEGDPDGDPNGDSATQEGERYWGLLSSQVRRFYDVAQTIPEQERLQLRAQVLMLIGRSGQLVRAELVKASGNSLFDNAVLTAVKRASPFSPPPESLRDQVQRTGVVLEFTP